MTVFKALRVVLALGATLFLSGCFVTSKNLPAGQGPINDDVIVGDWRGIDTETGKDEDVFVHIQKPEPDRPLRVIFVENRNYEIYELRTTQTGTHKVFSARVLGPQKAIKQAKGGVFLGYYEASGDQTRFWMLDAEKVTALIKEGKVRGVPGKSTYDFASLTGSPDELARFLASDDGWKSRVDDPTILKRLSSPQ